MRYRHILFDLDGTLTDPAQGICSCVMYALERGGYPLGKLSDYYKFIGPPLLESLQQHCGVTTSEAEMLLGYYRERFSSVGLYENEVYPGIPELLSALKDAGAELILATSKPEIYASRILEHFDLAQYFSGVTGSDLEGTRSQKSMVIAEALRRRGLTEPSQCIMVGDRRFDVAGARANGLACIGVLYGYGDAGELRDAGAKYTAATVGELRRFLLE